MITAIDIHQQIGSCWLTALLYEVYTSLKPGLVDRISNGAHTDMDLLLLESIAAISPYFKSFAEIGYNLDKIDETSLAKIRPLGIECEKAMFNATKGVILIRSNIFTGILYTAAGYCYKRDWVFQQIQYAMFPQNCQGSRKRLLLTNDTTFITNGLKLYAVYGIRGIRGEAAPVFTL